MSCPKKNCPLFKEVNEVVHLSDNLVLAIRKLRLDLKRCVYCEAGDRCSLRGRFDMQVQAAISQVTDEWNLAQEGA